MPNSEGKKRPLGRVKTTLKRKRKSEYIRMNVAGVEPMKGSENTQEEKYRILVQNIPCAVYSAYPGKAGPTTFMSNKWKDLTGYSPEELYQNPEAWARCIHRDDREHTVNTYIEACRGRMAYNLEYRVVHKDTGQLRYIRDQGHLSKDEKGAVVRVDGIVTDITELKKANNELDKYRDHLEELIKKRTAELTSAYETLKVENKERKRAEQALRETTNLLETIFELTHIMVAYLDTQYNFVRVNRAYAEADERQPSFFHGKNHFDLYPNKENEVIFRRVVETGVPYFANARPFEYAEHPERGVSYWDWSLVPIKNQQGIVSGLVFTLADVTARKRAEESLKASEGKLNAMLQSISDHMSMMDKDLNILWANDVAKRRFGDDIVGKKCYEVYHGRQSPCEPYSCLILRAFQDGGVHEHDTEDTDKDGNTAWFHCVANVALRNEEGEATAVLEISTDITERVLAEQALQGSEERFRAIYENALVGLYRTTPDGQILMANPALVQMLGYSSFEELAQLNLEEEGFSRDCQRSVFKQRVEAEDRIVGLESRWMRRDGTTLFVRESARTVRDKDGEILYYEGTVADLTERKKAEEELRIREQKLRALLNAPTESAILVDTEGTILDINRIAAQRLGKSAKSLIGMGIYDYLPADIAEYRKARGDEVIRSGKSVRFQDERGGRYYDTNIYPVFDDEGKVSSLAVFSGDITGRKRAEETLQESEERFRSLSESSPMGVFHTDKEGRVLYTNKRWQEITGLALEESLGFGWSNALHPDDKKILLEEWDRCLSEERGYLGEFRFVSKSGEVKWVYTKTAPIRSETGQVIGHVGSNEDITDRKHAEEALRESEEKFKSLAEQSPNMIFINKKGKVVYANKKCKEVLGYTREELCSPDFDFHILIAPESIDLINENFARHLRGEEVQPYDYCLINKKGERIEAINASKLIQYERETAILGVITDITERKRAEQALRESEERLKILFESAPDAYYIHDLEGKFVDGNRAAEELVGYQKEEVIGESFFELGMVAEADIPKSMAAIAENRDGKPAGPLELTLNHKDGSKVMVETRSFPVDIDGETLILGIARDISARKKAEEALREQRDRAQKYLDVAAVMFVALDNQGNVTLVNKKGCELLGWDEQEIVGKNWFDNFLPENIKEQVNAIFLELIAGKIEPTEYYENPILCKDGSQKIIAWYNTTLKDGSGNIIGSLGSGQDITESMRTDEELRRYDHIVSSSTDMMALLDKRFTYLAANASYLETFNKTRDEVIGHTVAEVFGKEFFETVIKPNAECCLAGEEINYQAWFDFPAFEPRYMDINYYPYIDVNNEVLGFVVNGRDITERKQAEKKLLDHQARLKSLASELSLAEERERHRLATELHDQIGQSLVISKIKLDQLRKSSTSDELTKALEEVCNYLGQIIDDTRTLTFDLSYPILYELGFEAAVAEWLTDQIQEKHRIETEFEDDGRQKPLDDDIRVLLFRNVRELLINVVKHAQANKVKVSIRKVKDNIHVSVEDDGVGFDPVEVTSMSTKRAEFGLFSIRERLEQLEGLIEIDSEMGRGSKITMTAPLKNEDEADGV